MPYRILLGLLLDEVWSTAGTGQQHARSVSSCSARARSITPRNQTDACANRVDVGLRSSKKRKECGTLEQERGKAAWKQVEGHGTRSRPASVPHKQQKNRAAVSPWRSDSNVSNHGQMRSATNENGIQS